MPALADPFAPTAEEMARLKRAALEKLAAMRSETVEELRAAAADEPELTEQLRSIARHGLARAQIKQLAGKPIAERLGLASLDELTAHVQGCADEEKQALLAELNEGVAAIEEMRREKSAALWAKARAAIPLASAAKLLAAIPETLAEAVDGEGEPGAVWADATPIPVATPIPSMEEAEAAGSEAATDELAALDKYATRAGRTGEVPELAATVTVHTTKGLLGSMSAHFSNHFSTSRVSADVATRKPQPPGAVAAAGGLPHWVAPPQEHELQGTKGFEKHAEGNGDYLGLHTSFHDGHLLGERLPEWLQPPQHHHLPETKLHNETDYLGLKHAFHGNHHKGERLPEHVRPPTEEDLADHPIHTVKDYLGMHTSFHDAHHEKEQLPGHVQPITEADLVGHDIHKVKDYLGMHTSMHMGHHLEDPAPHLECPYDSGLGHAAAKWTDAHGRPSAFCQA